MKTRTVLLVAVSLLLVALSLGCAGGLKESDVSYAGPMVDNLLAGMTARDYAVFSRDFSPEMKTGIPENAFIALVDQLQSKIGDYQSKTFAQAVNNTTNGVTTTIVVYKARYSNESADVLITVTFVDNNGKKEIVGLYFNSPKLRQ